MFRRILVTLDGSEFAEAALPTAVGLARKCGADLRLLTVHDSGWAVVNGEWGDAARSRARRYVESMRDRVEETWSDVTVSVREGFVVDEVLAEADEFRADLLVMATHGRGPLSRFWLGSVADRCLRRAHRPLLLIHPREPGAQAAVGALDVRRVVVPLDGSDLSETALDPAMELADLFGTPVALVRVLQEHAMFETELLPQTHEVNEQMLGESRVGASAYLDSVARWMAEWGSVPEIQIAVDDQVAHAILGAAGEDLIVMATHARTGINRAFLGSVADAVVRSAPGPVLVIPPEPVKADFLTTPTLAGQLQPQGV